jgi:hypothetical protein
MSTAAGHDASAASSGGGVSPTPSQHASPTDPKHDSTQGATGDPSVSFEHTQVVGGIEVTRRVEVTHEQRRGGAGEERIPVAGRSGKNPLYQRGWKVNLPHRVLPKASHPSLDR